MQTLIHTFNAYPATGIPVVLALAVIIYLLGRSRKAKQAEDLHGGTHKYYEIKRFRGEA